MAATPQTQAISNANQVMALGAQLLGLYSAIIAANNAWQDDSSLATLQAMGTVAQNADGTLGTPDGAPNNAHPLNTNSYPSLSHAVSVNQIASILTQLNNIVSFINGSALAATPGVRTTLNVATGG